MPTGCWPWVVSGAQLGSRLIRHHPPAALQKALTAWGLGIWGSLMCFSILWLLFRGTSRICSQITGGKVLKTAVNGPLTLHRRNLEDVPRPPQSGRKRPQTYQWPGPCPARLGVKSQVCIREMQVKPTQGDTTSHSLGWLKQKNRQWQVLVRILWS